MKGNGISKEPKDAARNISVRLQFPFASRLSISLCEIGNFVGNEKKIHFRETEKRHTFVN
jgi:hypothetical protein